LVRVRGHASPLCASARAALASGMEYDRCGVPDNSVDYPLGQPTFYALLHKAGYRVMGCGKFDLAKAARGWKIDGSAGLPSGASTRGSTAKASGDAVGSGQSEPRGPYMAFLEESGLRTMHSRTCGAGARPGSPPSRAAARRGLQRQLDRGGRPAAARDRPSRKPWFLQVNFTGPHDPWDITAGMPSCIAALTSPSRSASTPARRRRIWRCAATTPR